MIEMDKDKYGQSIEKIEGPVRLFVTLHEVVYAPRGLTSLSPSVAPLLGERGLLPPEPHPRS